MGMIIEKAVVATPAYPVVSRSASDGDSGNNCGSSMVCTFSPAPAANTLLLSFLQDGTGATSGPPSNGSGTAWTQFGASGHAWRALCNASQPTDYTITYYGVAKADDACFSAIEMTGVYSTPIDAWSANASSASSPSVTTAFANETAISVIFSTSVSGTDLTAPAGWTLVRRDAHGSTSGSAIGIAYKNYPTAGSTGSATWTLATGSPVYAFTITVRSE